METSQEMNVEVVLLVAVLTTNCATKGIRLVVTAHVQGVHHLVPESDVTVLARQLAWRGGIAAGGGVDGLGGHSVAGLGGVVVELGTSGAGGVICRGV